jgi:hypothetical protein
MTMIPVGYMAKRIYTRPNWLKASHVVDIHSVSGCQSANFADYIQYWKHNGYWLFDSPEIILNVAKEHSIQIEGTSLFYYKAYEKEFDGEQWNLFGPEPSFLTNVIPPSQKQLEGFDVVTFSVKTSLECSPLSCNSLAEVLPTNAHFLFPSFEDAQTSLADGAFKDSEPGPYRIFSVLSVAWPSA